MIMKMLELRTILLKVYQKARFIINPVIKFFLSMWAFTWINTAIGYDTRLTGSTIVMLLSAICAVTPGGVMVFFAMALTLAHVYSASIFLAILLLLMFIVMYGLLMRFAPKQALAAVAIPVLAKYNLHYCVPVVLGCVATPLSILPVACGVIIYNMMEIVKVASTRKVNIKNLDEVLQLYTDVVNAFMANKQMLIAIAVFAVVIITIFIIRKFSFSYSFMISIGAGVLVNILGFLIGDLHYDVTVNVGTLIGMSLVAGAVAIVFEYFKRVLDYTAIERVQFEDDDYYYYVKAVPKVNVSIPRHHVKRMSDYDEEDEEQDNDDGEDYQEDYEYGEDYTPASSANLTDETDEGEVTYEEFDDSDFDENADPVPGRRYSYGDDDLSSYGVRRIETSESPLPDGLPGDDDDEGYEVEMTLDDDDEN